MKKNKVKRLLLITGITIIGFVLLVIVFISPITKYLVEKYSVKYTGRQIKMNWAYVNPFTGYFYFRDLKIYENKNDTIFFSANGLGFDITLHKLFSHTLEFSSITLDKPWGRAIQYSKHEFNFSDIIDHFASKGDTLIPHKNPLHVSLLDIQVNNGEFHYRQQAIPVNYYIKDVHFASSGKWWNCDTMNVQFFFRSGPDTGMAKGSWTFNFANGAYRLNTVINHLDLKTLEQYMHTMANYGSFTANLDADVKAVGSFKDATELDAKGMIAINNFHIGKIPGEDYGAFDRMIFRIDKLNPKDHIYFFDSLVAIHPYFLYEKYDYLDNLERMFGVNGKNVDEVTSKVGRFNLLIALARYAQQLAVNFFESDFKINNLAIKNGDIKYNDYSPREEFSMAAAPLNITADSIYKNHQRVNISLKTKLKPYGNASIYLSVNPKNDGDFDMTYHFGKLSIPLFNPYIITYTSFPFDRGVMELNGNWIVRNGIVQSTNHLLIIDPYTDKRLHKKDTKWVPVPLIMAFIRNRGGVIDFQIPITGDIKNPHVHLKYVILDILKNIFIKPPTVPYGIHINDVEKAVENSIIVTWQMRQAQLGSPQKRFVKKIASFLKKNPEASISIAPLEYTEKEKEYILFYEAKKKYFMLIRNKTPNSFSKDDSIYVDKMSVKDSFFVHYLDKHVADSMMFTIQEKCSRFIGQALISNDYNHLLKNREADFLNYFRTAGVEKQVHIYPSESGIPFQGFSYYQIKYNKGELPDELKKAYREMDEIDEGWFRKKYENIVEKYEKPLAGKL